MQPEQFRILFQGLDTLHIAFYGFFDYLWWEQANLKKLKIQAQQKKETPYFNIHGDLWEVSERGSREYAYCLLRKGWRIYLLNNRGMNSNYIQMKIEVPSERLRLGMHELEREFLMLAAGVFTGSYEYKIQRVDIAVDVSGFFMGNLAGLFMYGYPQKMNTINTDMSLREYFALGKNYLAETVDIGKSPKLRIYDKKKLALKEDHDWFLSWFQKIPSEIKHIPEITRFEFQLRSQVLKEFQILSFGHLIEKIQGLWNYMVFEWLEMKVDDPTKKCKRKLPIAPIWFFLRGVEFGEHLWLKRVKTLNRDSIKNFKQIIGHFSSFLAKENISLTGSDEELCKKQILRIFEKQILNSPCWDWDKFFEKLNQKKNLFHGL